MTTDRPITGPDCPRWAADMPAHVQAVAAEIQDRNAMERREDVAARVLATLLRDRGLNTLLAEPPHGEPELSPTARRLVTLARLFADELCGPAIKTVASPATITNIELPATDSRIHFRGCTINGVPVPDTPASPPPPTPSVFTADLTADQLTLLHWVRDGDGHRRYAYERAPVTDEERAVYARKLQKMGLLATFADGTGYGLKLTQAGAVVLGVTA